MHKTRAAKQLDTDKGRVVQSQRLIPTTATRRSTLRHSTQKQLGDEATCLILRACARITRSTTVYLEPAASVHQPDLLVTVRYTNQRPRHLKCAKHTSKCLLGTLQGCRDAENLLRSTKVTLSSMFIGTRHMHRTAHIN